MNTDYNSLIKSEKDLVNTIVSKIAVKFCCNPNEII